VAECAVVGCQDSLKGEIPIGFVVTQSSELSPAELSAELRQLVREKIGPIACYATTHVVPKLPKTRSGKILRKTIKAIMQGEAVTIPPTIEDPAALEAFTSLFAND
jgi:propionyl-CoA synthetase